MNQTALLHYVDNKLTYWRNFSKLNIMKAHEVELKEKAPHYIAAYEDVKAQIVRFISKEKKYTGAKNSYL